MRLSNGLFAHAVNYLIDNKIVKDQQELSARTGITGTTISRILNDKVKQPSAETMKKLFDAFPGLFNPKYFRGENAYMLMEDYIDAQNETKQKQEPEAHLDNSSLMNAALSAKDETIASLQREMTTKDELIQSLREQLASKDELIAEQKARLIDYRRIINSQQGIGNYPFPIGAAESAQESPRK